MKTDPILNKAALLARKRNYEGALSVLKADEERYYDSFKYYYLYAVISLYSGNYEEAQENFKLARKIKMKDPNTMLGLAIHSLRMMKTVQAVDYYLDVQEMEPKNKVAKRALAVIRKNSASEALSGWMTTDRIKKLFPPIPSPAAELKTVIKTAAICAAVLLFAYGFLAVLNVLPNPFKPERRPNAGYALSSQERIEPVRVDGVYRYIYTRDQVISLYENSLSLFTSYRDEAAKINLNRILESNASDGIKNRARLIMDNMEVPGFDTFKRNDNPSFTDVKNETAVYRDVHVIWRGMATNVEVTDKNTTFDFLVGYDTRRTLEGIVPVVFDIPVAVNTERPLEVLGRIVPEASYSEFRLEGVAIHQSGRLEWQ